MARTEIEGVRRMARTEIERMRELTERVCELTEAMRRFGAVVDDLVCYTDALRMERKALRDLVAGMYRDIVRAYVSGRPLEPYQYDDAIAELGIET